MRSNAKKKPIVKAPELAIIIPVYNESAVIKKVITEWHKELNKLKVDFEIHVYNDGSTDHTQKELEVVAKKLSRVVIHENPNQGHGATILQGYVEHLDSEWIFQVDSDNEISATHFKKLWKSRDGYDFVLGYRHNRRSPLSRKIVTLVCRLAVGLFFGRGVIDVNAPYRLMRSSKFHAGIENLEAQTFAPNVALSGFAVHQKLRVRNLPVDYQFRTTGAVSIKKWKLFKAATKSFLQVLGFRITLIGRKF